MHRQGAGGYTAAVAGAEVRDFWPLRVPLLETEVERYRALGRAAAAAFTETLERVTPGLSEHDVAARIAYALRERGMQPALILVAADERLQRYRHPLPTNNVFHDRLMVVACARRHGLYANLTRIISAGTLADDARDAYGRLLEVESTLLDYTQHGVLTRELFPEMQRAYADAGFDGRVGQASPRRRVRLRDSRLVVATRRRTDAARRQRLRLEPVVAGAQGRGHGALAGGRVGGFDSRPELAEPRGWGQDEAGGARAVSA